MKHRVRMICVFLAATLALTCCSLESRAVRQEIRTWNGFVYGPWGGCGGFEGDKSDIRLEILNYKGTKRELTIPTRIDGMKVVSVSSLSKAKNLRTLHIPNGVEVHYALAKAPKLKKVTVLKSNKKYSVKNNALLNKKGTVLMGYPGGYSTLKVPDSVKWIGSELRGRGFKSIKWGKNVTRIRDGAFYENAELETLVLKNKVQIIERDAFYGCKKLKTVVLGKNVKKIGDMAFVGCGNLESIYIYNRNCEIAPCDEYDYGNYFLAISRETTIYGWKGSTAEKYARKYNIKFEGLEKPDLSGFLPNVPDWSLLMETE